MKKLLGILALATLTVSAFAQGTVTFANQTGLIQQWTSGADQTAIAVPKNTGYVQLIAAPKGTALVSPLFTVGAGGLLTAKYETLSTFLGANPGWALPRNTTGIGTPAPIALGAGLFAGGAYTIDNIGAGAEAAYMYLGWTGSATSFDAALADRTGFLGLSAIATSATSLTTGNPSPPVPINLRTTFGGMTLAGVAPVPEPTSFALAGLGLAALLVLRRRS